MAFCTKETTVRTMLFPQSNLENGHIRGMQFVVCGSLILGLQTTMLRPQGLELRSRV